MRRWIVTVSIVGTIVLLTQLPGAGQAPALKRTADGKPDLNGIWQALNTAAWDIQDHAAQLGIPAGMGVVEGNEIPYQPAALAKKQENVRNRMTADLTDARGFLPGVPRSMYMPYPFQIVQTPALVSMFFEYAHGTRNVYMNSSHIEGEVGDIEWWMGDSRGRWEGDTLVIDARHFNDQTWFDKVGNFHSNALHLVERLTLIGPDHISYEVTVEDPKVFTRPWKMSMPLYRRKEPGLRIMEYDAGAMLDEALERQKALSRRQ